MACIACARVHVYMCVKPHAGLRNQSNETHIALLHMGGESETLTRKSQKSSELECSRPRYSCPSSSTPVAVCPSTHKPKTWTLPPQRTGVQYMESGDQPCNQACAQRLLHGLTTVPIRSLTASSRIVRLASNAITCNALFSYAIKPEHKSQCMIV